MTGKYLDSDEICQEDKIIFTDNIENKLLESKVNLQLVKEFFNEGIDIFNMSSPFYTDICFQYNSKKDIALKDRVLEYFPNITLCEDGCELLGINMSTITAICECFYIESKREENIKNKVMEQSQISFVEDIITRSNIYVIKCIDLVFKKNTIKKSYGSIIIVCLMLIELICIIFYSKNNIYSINKYILSLTNKYINYLLVINSNKIQIKNSLRNKTKLISNENIVGKNAPPKQNKRKTMNYMKPNIAKIEKKSKTIRKPKIRGDINIIFNNNNETNNKNNINKQNQIISNNNKIMSIKNNKRNIPSKSKYEKELSNLSEKGLFSEYQCGIQNEYNSLFINVNNNLDININEYLETEYDEMDYYEAIKKDNRKFCACYIEKLKDNQIIVNTFFSNDPIKPKSIKILFLILNLNLYFFINGLFYDEEYISKIYHLEKDTFFTKAERFFDNLIYAALAGIIINYIIEFFFIEQKKIRKIMKIEKDRIFILKYEMVKILKSIKTRYLSFIIISFIISIISLVHICCFNIVYYHTISEWIVFSIIIILSMQMLSFFICFLQTTLRFISFKIKSEKLYNISI